MVRYDTTKNKKNLNKNQAAPQELSDEEVSRTAGGTFFGLTLESGAVSQTPDQWIGTDDSQKYLCPLYHCPVHRGFLCRYCCNACGKGWFDESKLELNLDGGWRKTEGSLKE